MNKVVSVKDAQRHRGYILDLFLAYPDDLEDFKLATMTVLGNLAFEATKGCLFPTNSGYVGRSYNPIQTRDLICILFGCNVPAVSQPQSDGTQTLISFACIDGLMYGELFQGDRKPGEQEFVLS